MWLTLRKSILTKDNLLRRGWKGNPLCHFCGGLETVDHLFISCSAARLIWSVLRCAFNLNTIPDSMEGLFGTWLNSFNAGKKNMVLVGVAAVLWSIWNARNEICFDNKKIHDPMVLVHRVIHWINLWSMLQIKQGNREAMTWGAKLLERVVNEVFHASRGWRTGRLRITG